MNPRSTLTRILLVITASLVTGFALADPHGSHPHGPDMDRMAILLDLNDSQKAAVQEILEQQHERIRASREELKASGTRPTREEMQQKHEQMKQEVVSKLQGVLTPEQITKFEALTDHGSHERGH